MGVGVKVQCACGFTDTIFRGPMPRHAVATCHCIRCRTFETVDLKAGEPLGTHARCPVCDSRSAIIPDNLLFRSEPLGVSCPGCGEHSLTIVPGSMVLVD
jgi:hypothetical protein